MAGITTSGANPTEFAITFADAGTYNVMLTASDLSGLESSWTAQITVNPDPTVRIAGAASYDVGQTITLTTSATGTGTLTYQWYNDSTGTPMIITTSQVPSATSSTFTETAGAARTVKYYVVVTDQNGATARSTPDSQVVVPAPPTVSITGTTTYDSGQTITLSSSVSGDYSSISSYQWYNHSVSWSPAAIPGATASTYSAKADTTGSFKYYVVVGGLFTGGAVQSPDSQVVVSPAPSVSVSGTTAADVGQTITLTASATGTGTLSYQWYNGTINNMIPTADTPTYTANSGATGIFSYFVVVVDSLGGRVVSAPASVTVNNAITSGNTVTAVAGNFIVTPSTTGQAVMPSGTNSLILNDNSILNVSSSISTVSGGNMVIGGSSIALNSVTTGSGTVNLEEPQSVGGVSIQVANGVELDSGVSGTSLTITNAGLPDASVSIPDNTIVFASSSWTGTITPPTSGSSSGTAPSGFSVGNTVIEVGSPDSVLLLSQPAIIVLTGATGAVGYKPAGSGTWTQINSVCGGTYANPAAPAFPGACYITNNVDTEIVTYHFTTFGILNSYVAPTVVPPAPSSGGGSGGSIIGGGGSVNGASGAEPTGPGVSQFTQHAASCYQISNFTAPNSESFTLGDESFTVTASQIMSSSVAMIINGKTYILPLNSQVGIGSSSNINYTADLVSLSYLPILHTATVNICSISTAATTQTSNVQASTTTILQTSIYPTSANTLATTPRPSVTPPASSNTYLIAAIVVLIVIVLFLMYRTSRTGNKDAKKDEKK
jgi:hypothetical protein